MKKEAKLHVTHKMKLPTAMATAIALNIHYYFMYSKRKKNHIVDERSVDGNFVTCKVNERAFKILTAKSLTKNQPNVKRWTSEHETKNVWTIIIIIIADSRSKQPKP